MTPTIITGWQFLFMIISFITPKIIAFGQNPKWNKYQKLGVNVIFNVLIATAALGAAGLLTPTNLVGSATLLVMYSTLSYLGIWKPTQLNEKTFQMKRGLVRGLKRKLNLGPDENTPR